jgi:hypothetical protein
MGGVGDSTSYDILKRLLIDCCWPRKRGRWSKRCYRTLEFQIVHHNYLEGVKDTADFHTLDLLYRT